MAEDMTTLKTPWPLRVLALCFLVAPFGNILISIASSAIPDWYHPSTFALMLQSIPPFEWLWLSSVLACGVLLLIQHKLAWASAVATLFLVLGVNVYKSFAMVEEMNNRAFPMKYQIGLSVLGTLTVLMVIFYARYPYLDRRDSWFGRAMKRYDVNLRAKILAGKEGHGFIRSLSVTGARLDWTSSLQLSDLQEVEISIPGSPVATLKARVVACDAQVLRLKFLGISKEEKKQLTEWLEKDSSQSKAS